MLILSLSLLLIAATACTPGNDEVDNDEVAAPAEPLNWTVQSYSVAGTEAHEWVEAWADRVRTMSQGQIDMEVHPGAAIVGYDEMREAVTDGVMDLTLNAPGFFMGDDPAFGAWFNMPVLPLENPELGRYLVRQWVNEFGGLDLARELYEPFDLYVVGAMMTQNEPVHSKTPLRTLDDYRGLRCRSAPGLTAAMFEAVGVTPVAMPGGEIYTALDTGVVDCAEFVGFTENLGLGLHEVTDYVQWPAFHSQVPIIDITVHQDTWNELPDHLKLILEDSLRWLEIKIDHHLAIRDREVIAELEERGIEIVSLPPEDVEQAEQLGLETTQAWADESEMSEKIVNSFLEYLRSVGQMD